MAPKGALPVSITHFVQGAKPSGAFYRTLFLIYQNKDNAPNTLSPQERSQMIPIPKTLKIVLENWTLHRGYRLGCLV